MDGWTDGRTDGWTDGHSARDVGGERATSKAGSKQARLYESQRRYYANGSACPRLGSARSRSGARASPTLPRRLAAAAVGRFVLSMPLRRRPRRSSVTRLSTRGTSRSVLRPDSAVPAASERHAGSSRAVPRRATPRHATARRSRRADVPADALFRKRARVVVPLLPYHVSVSSSTPQGPIALYSSAFLSPVTFSRSRQFSLPPFQSSPRDVCFSPSGSSFIAVVSAVVGPSSFRAHLLANSRRVSLQHVRAPRARFHRGGSVTQDYRM